jgi:hypothetical protein
MTTRSATPGRKAKQTTRPTSQVGTREACASAAVDGSDQSDLLHLTPESLAALGALARLLGRQVAREAARAEGGDE